MCRNINDHETQRYSVLDDLSMLGVFHVMILGHFILAHTLYIRYVQISHWKCRITTTGEYFQSVWLHYLVYFFFEYQSKPWTWSYGLWICQAIQPIRLIFQQSTLSRYGTSAIIDLPPPACYRACYGCDGVWEGWTDLPDGASLHLLIPGRLCLLAGDKLYQPQWHCVHHAGDTGRQGGLVQCWRLSHDKAVPDKNQ